MFPFHRVPRWSGLKCISQLFDDFCTKAVFQCFIVGKVLVNKVATHFDSKHLSPYFSILMEIVKINYMSKIYCCFITLEVNYSWEFYFYIYKISSISNFKDICLSICHYLRHSLLCQSVRLSVCVLHLFVCSHVSTSNINCTQSALLCQP